MIRRPRDLDSIFGDDGSPIFLHSELYEIEVSKLKAYPGHSFKKYSEIKMSKMVESINSVGVLEPIIVYENNGKYMILAGYNRVEASKHAMKSTIPAIVKKDLTKVQQVEIMNFTNFFQRGTGDCYISELAKAFRMEYEALLEEKSKNRNKFEGNVIRKYLADMYEMTDSKMQRYLAISKLIPELMDCLDLNRINFSVGLIFATLTDELQEIIYQYLIQSKCKMSIKLAEKLKGYVLQGKKIDKEYVEKELQKNKDCVTKQTENKTFASKRNYENSKFFEEKLPKWLTEHNVVYDNDIERYLMNVLKRIYKECPNILQLKS